MEKRRRSVSLSFVLLHFVIVMLGCMLLCLLAWWGGLIGFQNNNVVYRPTVPNQQVEQMLAGAPKTFVSPGDDFLPEYALLDKNGEVLESNVEGKKLETLSGFLDERAGSTNISRYTYADGSTVILHWRWRAEFTSPVLRKMLLPFEYLWFAVLCVALLLCLLFNTLWLRRRLATKLRLFSEVSEKVGAQELDFTIPKAGIREYDQALDAMDGMRIALKESLAAQWAAERQRQMEISALAHDLKTPLTIIGGNAELLLEESVGPGQKQMVESIESNANRAKLYISSMLDAAAGTKEAFEQTSLSALLEEAVIQVKELASNAGVQFAVSNHLTVSATVQPERMHRAIENIIRNAIEHTPTGETIWVSGENEDGKSWRIRIEDSGDGFSDGALQHATERFWRDDLSRGNDGHSGLGLWFVSDVIHAHKGTLILRNGEHGGIVEVVVLYDRE
jgi:signal transduction histidine kinase